ncbi:hypothetical protein Asru_0047_02 [Acidisphaera rubrifaciens HS-AP3]|uniref:Uncharacterized protein n=1 Tax=Acidisphaera rubrifaciens HS-AP3 TaxID=1231350 RepID=A0A0D6P5A1_9PROT|nr:hypothetical protein Asru_0047_02 [Acidisphaera rubrifaciens HS-AP3]
MVLAVAFDVLNAVALPNRRAMSGDVTGRSATGWSVRPGRALLRLPAQRQDPEPTKVSSPPDDGASGSGWFSGNPIIGFR